MRHACLICLFVVAFGFTTVSHAAVMVTADAGVATPGLPGFRTYTVTATSDVPGEIITGVDFYGSGPDGSPTARGFFGPMNQLMAGPFTTVFQDTNPFLPPTDGPLQDSQFLFRTTGVGAVISPAGFNSESPTSLRALFSRAGGFGQSVPLAQTVIQMQNGSEVGYRGTFSVLRGGVNVTLPEISSLCMLCVDGFVNIVPINLGPTSAAIINQQLIAIGDPPLTWSNLTPASGSPAVAATLTPEGQFQWHTVGSARGPIGNGIPYSWQATVTNASGADTDIGISLTLEFIPEPATLALLGLATTGLAGVIRRRARSAFRRKASCESSHFSRAMSR